MEGITSFVSTDDRLTLRTMLEKYLANLTANKNAPMSERNFFESNSSLKNY